MNALIIMGANFNVTPYYRIYVDALQRGGATISVVCWNRTLEDEHIDPEISVSIFYKKIDNSIAALKKLPSFIEFRRFVKGEIKNKKYDLIIALDTQFAVLITDVLLKYKGKYIYDMRDLSYEKYKVYRKIMNVVEKNSIHTFLSSKAYEQFFDDKSKISIFHNYKKNDVDYNIQIQKQRKNRVTFDIGYWGCLRDVMLYEEFILKFKNDKRFELHFYGIKDSNMKSLEHFVNDNNINNVSFYGEYKEDERYNFARKTDVILNIYDNPFNEANPIMSNKYYDGIFFGIPQICSQNSYMGRLIEEKKLGLVYSDEREIADELFEYLTKLDRDVFIDNCLREKIKIVKEQEESLNVLENIIKFV